MTIKVLARIAVTNGDSDTELHFESSGHTIVIDQAAVTLLVNAVPEVR